MTMKLKEPNKIAFDIDDGINLDHDTAASCRSEAFWKVVESEFVCTSVKDGKDFQKSDHCPDCERAVHDKMRELVLDSVNRYSRDIAQRKEFNLPSGTIEEMSWENVKFIVAFDTSFSYTPEEFLDADDDDDHSETDYLDYETSFCLDVVKACDRLALEGAALAKQIGSDTYSLWRDAQLKLNSNNGKIKCKAIDDIVAALELLWADWRTWIFMNPPDIAKKTTKRRSKSKK